MSRHLSLSELLDHLTEDDGPLPDATAVGSTGQEWRGVLAFLESCGWPLAWSDTDVWDPDDPDDLIRRGNCLAAWPTPGVQINFFPGDDVSFDFDRRELRDQAAADALGEVMRRLGRHLGREIAVSYEGSSSVFLRYDPETDEFLFQA